MPSTATPSWVHEPLVVCVDGPKENQWFTVQDWKEMVAAAERMAELGQRRTPVLDYRQSKSAPIPHPDEPRASGTPLVYRPAR